MEKLGARRSREWRLLVYSSQISLVVLSALLIFLAEQAAAADQKAGQSAVAAPPAAKEPERKRPPSLYGHVALELLAIPDDKLKLGDAALRLSTLLMPGETFDDERRQLDQIAAAVAARIAGKTDPEYRIRAINTVLFQQLKFRYDLTDIEGLKVEQSTLLGLMRSRKGNCVSLPALWYAVAERLNLPVFAVLAPNHVFLRYDDGKVQSNIEATADGEEATDERYIGDLEIPDEGVKSGAFMRSLSKREFLAHLISDVGEKLLRAHPALAVELFDYSLKVFPSNIHAHWNAALAWNDLAFVELSRSEGGFRRYGTKKGKLPQAGFAMDHALAATELGAPRPLEKDFWKKDEYWRRVSKLFSKEGSVRAKRPKLGPFDVTSVLMRPNSHVTLNMTWEVDPILYNRSMRSLDGCARFCSRFCGPAPGNLCAADMQKRGLMWP